MEIAFDFNEEFGNPQEVLCKKFNKIKIQIHPAFAGIYLCYLEAFKSLKANLSIFTVSPQLYVWKDSNISGYTITTACHWYLYWSKNTLQPINLIVRTLPQEEKKIALLKTIASEEFIRFLSSYHHDLDKLNPKRLQMLINTHISSETILALNKKHSYKPHNAMSLELLAQLLCFSRNQLNYRCTVIDHKRQHVLDQLQQSSSTVQRLVNDRDFIISPEHLWKT